MDKTNETEEEEDREGERYHPYQSLRERAIEMALDTCTEDETYGNIDDLIRDAQTIFEYLKNGTLPGEDKEDD